MSTEPAVRIKLYGDYCRFALVSAQTDAGQNFLDELFDFLEETFIRGHLILDLDQVIELSHQARIREVPILLDLR